MKYAAILLCWACASAPAPTTRQIAVPASSYRQPERGVGSSSCDERFATACGATPEQCRAAIDTIAMGCAPRVEDMLPPGYGPAELMQVGEMMAHCTLVTYVVERQAEGYSCDVPPPDEQTIEQCQICEEGPTQIM